MEMLNATGNSQTSDRQFEAMAWGTFFVWWGLLELFPLLPDGTGAIGIGVILLGLNAVRLSRGIPTSGFTTTLGGLALLWGGLEFANVFVGLPFELPTFAILLIVFGLSVLVRGLVGRRQRIMRA